MSLFDKLGGALSSAIGQGGAGSLIESALAQTSFGNLGGLVAQLQTGGLDAQVKSWLGDGANLPVSPEQIRAALGSQQVKQLAERFGLPADEITKLLAEHLPGVVDQASPNGTVQ